MSIESLGIAGVAAITAICYLAGAAVKAWGKADKWIPTICGILGGVLGALALSIMPEFPAGDHISAVAVGIISGLAATGVNQAVKQVSKKEGE